MRKRDKAILDDLNRFRCMSRDDIMDLYFSHLKEPVKGCNAVLKRLRRDGYIEANTNHQPFVYFQNPSPIKKDSQKIPHFLSILDVFKQLLKYEKPKQFIVEPKYGKDYMEPDAFAWWKKNVFFIEVQRSIYSEKVMYAKIERYEKYFESREWYNELWQIGSKKVFPKIILITDTRYAIKSNNFSIFQVGSIKEFIENYWIEEKKPVESTRVDSTKKVPSNYTQPKMKLNTNGRQIM